MVSRVFTVLASILLVGAFGLAVTASIDLTLVQSLTRLSPDFAQHLRPFVIAHLGNGLWVHGFVPCLVRPAWLLPAFLGVICLGLAGSLRATPSADTRRRSL